MKKVLFSLVAMLLLSVSGIAQSTFTKITSAAGLEAGANYLIVAHNDDLGVLAMGNQRTSNRNAVVVTEDGDVVTVTLGTDPESTTDVFQITLGGSEGAWTLFDEVLGGYLYASSSNANQLKTQSTLDDNGQWAITFSEDGTAQVVAQGENTRNYMRFNPNVSNNAPIFSCYGETSTVGSLVSFYKAGTVAPVPEPSNYPTNFTATVDGVDVTLSWTDATGGQLPSKYLVVASAGGIPVPMDGVPVPNDYLTKNVNYGVGHVTFSGLEGGLTYHFAIFPYTNSGSNINYKTDGTYPTVDATTEDIYYLLFEDFDEDLGMFTAYDVYGEQGWHQATNQGTSFANMNGYANGGANQNEDWLIGYVQVPELTFTDILVSFRTAMKFDGDPLRVMLSNDYDGQSDPTDFEWENITDAFEYSTGNYEWVESGEVNVIDIVNATNFYIAFVYTSTPEAAVSWEVDFVKVIGKFTASVNESSKAISLYPNPANEQVSFVLVDNAEVGIFDITGRMVSTTNCEAGQAQLNVSELVNGVYFVNVRYANGSTAVTKFVKF